MKKLLIGSILIVLFDQVSKWMITHFLSLFQSITVIPSFFSITYVRNTGAAWSILSGNSCLLSMIGCVALFLIYYYFIRNQKLNSYDEIMYAFLMGGIIGNLIDRIFYGSVIDFLDFTIFHYNYPVFNFADVGIVIGIFLLMIKTLRGEKVESTSN